MLREHETAIDEVPDLAAFPVTQQQLNQAAHGRTTESEWYRGWNERYRQALRVVHEQRG